MAVARISLPGLSASPAAGLSSTGSITSPGARYSGPPATPWTSGRIAAIGSGVTAVLDTNGNSVIFASGLTGDGGLTGREAAC